MVSSGLSKSERFKIKPTPFLAIFEADMETLIKSKIVIIWFIVSFFIGALIITGNAAKEAKESISSNMFLFIFLWSLVIIGLSAGAISSESGVVADSVLSKSVKRHEYIMAKLCSRLTLVLTVYLIVIIILSLLSLKVSQTGTMKYAGWIAGVLSVALALAFLTTMGVMFSTLTTSTVVSVIATLLAWFSMLIALPLAGMSEISPAYLVQKMPEVMGSWWDTNLSQIVGVLAGLSVLFVLIAVYYFDGKDLGSE